MEEERRNDSEIRVIAERVDNLKGQLEASDKLSEAWRERFCVKLDIMDNKMDSMTHKLDTLPCPQRIEATKGMLLQLRALWLVTGGMLLTIITEWLGRR